MERFPNQYLSQYQWDVKGMGIVYRYAIVIGRMQDYAINGTGTDKNRENR